MKHERIQGMEREGEKTYLEGNKGKGSETKGKAEGEVRERKRIVMEEGNRGSEKKTNAENKRK